MITRGVYLSKQESKKGLLHILTSFYSPNNANIVLTIGVYSKMILLKSVPFTGFFPIKIQVITFGLIDPGLIVITIM